jgi:opacity protein-like surface antigen
MKPIPWKSGWPSVVAVCVVLACVLAAPLPAAAQDSQVGDKAVGIEAGLPLVFGLDASYRVDPSWRIGLGFGRLSGFTVIRAQARWLALKEQADRLVPSLVAGAEQYFLSKGDRDATPIGIHAAVGLDYHFRSPMSLGARIGILRTFASSDGGDLKVFGIKNGFTTGLFNIGLRYHF